VETVWQPFAKLNFDVFHPGLNFRVNFAFKGEVIPTIDLQGVNAITISLALEEVSNGEVLIFKNILQVIKSLFFIRN
jgi:hypothetical protein